MINNEMKTITIKTFQKGSNKYGQVRQGDYNVRYAEMVIKPYRILNTSDIRYSEVTNIGLTADKAITDSDQILFDGVTYNVLYIVPSGRLHQIFMKKV